MKIKGKDDNKSKFKKKMEVIQTKFAGNLNKVKEHSRNQDKIKKI